MNAATIRLLDLFASSHLPARLQPISGACGTLAVQMATQLESDDMRVIDELLVGLRRLLEAKDCFVRAALHVHLQDTMQALSIEVKDAHNDSAGSDYL